MGRGLLWVCVVVALMARGGSAGAEPPSFVVIMFDDCGYTDVGMTGGDLLPTPRIDSIAEDGVTFTQGYVTASVCSPSRAGFISGRYQQRYGHEFNLGGPDEEAGLGLPGSTTTIAEIARAAGYRTGLIGKWHLGTAEGLRPTDQGFDVFHGLYGGARSYFREDAPRVNRVLRDGTDARDDPEGLYVTDWIADRASAFIDQSGDEPYFLFVSFTAPHTPMHALEEDLDAVDATTELEGRRRIYTAMMRSLDRAVGEVLDAVDASERSADTAVFLVNDNGGATDNGSDNGPFRGMKGSKWEGGIRIPFALRWPGVARPGSSFHYPVTTLDIGAMLAAVSGASADDVAQPGEPGLDGVDLTPFLRGERTGAPHEILFWRRGVAAAVRHGPWKLIRSEGNPTLLFDLHADPSERHDVSGLRREIVQELTAKLEAWESDLATPGWTEGEKWERNQRSKHRIEVETRAQERRYP